MAPFLFFLYLLIFLFEKGHAMDIHVHHEKPFYAYEFTTPKNWKSQKWSESSQRFLPPTNIDIHFEVPPSLDTIALERVPAEDVEWRVKEEGENAHGVTYKAVYLKGWAASGYLLSRERLKIYLIDAVGEHREFGLSGSQLLEQARDSFSFINPDHLLEKDVRRLLLASDYRKLLTDTDAQLKATTAFQIVTQGDKYVVSFKGLRGGPIFHIFKKDLRIVHFNKK